MLKKSLSCVVRMGERFGKTAVAQVLIGSKNKNIANGILNLYRLLEL